MAFHRADFPIFQIITKRNHSSYSLFNLIVIMVAHVLLSQLLVLSPFPARIFSRSTKHANLETCHSWVFPHGQHPITYLAF